MRRPLRSAAAWAFTFLVTANGVEAGDGHPFRRARGTPPPGTPRTIEHTHRRAGDPLCLSTHAAPSNTPAYDGYHVGGGSSHGGDARCPAEGTWGWDYVGLRLPRKVALRWGHGRRGQGGTGSYGTDGPHVPDVIGLTATRLRLHGGGEPSEP